MDAITILLGVAFVAGIDFFSRGVSLPHLGTTLGLPLAMIALAFALAVASLRAAHPEERALRSLARAN